VAGCKPDIEVVQLSGAGGMGMGSAAFLTVEHAYERLLRVALQRQEEGYREEAVIFAQTACELRVEAALSELLHRRVGGELGQAVEGLAAGFSLRHSSTQRLWTALTGDKITQTGDTWRLYDQHVKRRHHVVHQGLQVDDEQAQASVEAASAFMRHIGGVVELVRHRRAEDGKPGR